MWRWLFDAYRLLGIHLEIIDDHGHIVTPPSSASAELRNAVTAQRNVEAFLTHETRGSMVLAGMSVSSTPIVSERAVAGAVLIAVRASDALEESHLARVGSALAKAIAEQLSQSAHDRLDSLHKISALYQLLHAGVAVGSESAVLRTFAEALSIWEDLEIFAYRADLRRRYSLEVTLPGSNVSAVPRVLDQFADTDRLAISVLSAGEGVSEDLGVGADASSVHLSTAGGSWLIATRSTRQGGPVMLSELYFAALAHALNAAVAVEASRLTWAVMQQFVAGESAIAGRGARAGGGVVRPEGGRIFPGARRRRFDRADGWHSGWGHGRALAADRWRHAPDADRRARSFHGRLRNAGVRGPCVHRARRKVVRLGARDVRHVAATSIAAASRRG